MSDCNLTNAHKTEVDKTKLNATLKFQFYVKTWLVPAPVDAFVVCWELGSLSEYIPYLLTAVAHEGSKGTCLVDIDELGIPVRHAINHEVVRVIPTTGLPIVLLAGIDRWR